MYSNRFFFATSLALTAGGPWQGYRVRGRVQHGVQRPHVGGGAPHNDSELRPHPGPAQVKS